MKLYNVPNKTWVKVLEDAKVPPVAPKVKQETIIFFDHIDGMYSYCLTESEEVVHLAAWTEVEIIEDKSICPQPSTDESYSNGKHRFDKKGDCIFCGKILKKG